jgi:uncharacterized membrane protein YccC
VELEALLPDLATGVRGALVTATPLLLSIQLARPELVWMAFGGWLGTLTDPGGSRGLRARVLTAFLVVGMLLVWAGQRIASRPPVAVLLFAAIAGAASFLRSLGPAAGVMGTTLSIVAAIATAIPSASSLRDALWFSAGGGVALVFSSILWPVWTHLPVRRSVARAFEELSAYGGQLAACVDAGFRGGDERWTALARRNPRRVRDALEQARAMSLAVHARRSGESVMGGNLRVLLGLAEKQFRLLITLASELETVSPGRRPPETRAALERVRQRADEVRGVLLARSWRPPRVEESPSPGAAPEGPGRLLTLLERESADAVALVGSLDEEPRTEPLAARASRSSSEEVSAALKRLRDSFSPRSPIFRHAIRVTCAAALAGWAGMLLSPHHAAWVSITTVAVLQPYIGGTVKRAAERVVGTVLGSGLVVVLAAWSKSSLAMALLMFPMSMAAVVTRPRSYHLFSFFVTPVFVLIAMRYPGDWWTAATRAGDALLGGAIALAAALTIYPRWEERIGMPDALAAMAHAVEAYRDLVLRTLSARQAATDAQVVQARRAAGVAISEAETSLERRLAEPLRRGPDEARAMEQITFARRLAHSVTALDTLAAHSPPGAPPHQAAIERVSRFSGLLRGAFTPAAEASAPRSDVAG